MAGQPGIRVFHTAEHPCGYWHERLARDLVLDPDDPRLPEVYASALAMGFRRSGGHVYRPHCEGCRACVPVRIAAADFVPDRAQRRCLARNADVDVAWAPAERSEEAFALYRRYLAARHRGGGMDEPTPEEFDRFLLCPWGRTRFLAFRLRGELVAVAATDLLPGAMSAVYTFFSPDHAARSLGRLAVLSQIEHAVREGFEFLYLGFWLDGHPKMDYKRRFRPLQHFDGRQWRPLAVE